MAGLDNVFDGAAGSAIGGALSLFGSQDANAANKDIAAANNAWSAQQFATRYQTTVADLKAAGLNPMLAYSQGGGSPPTASQVAPMQNALGAGVDAYNKTKGTSAQSALQEQQVKVATSQENLNNAQAAKVAEEAKLIQQDAEKRKLEQPLVQQQTTTSADLAKAYQGQATASAAQAAQAYKQVELITQNIGNLKADLQRLQQANDQNKPESEIAKKYPTFYYIFHKLMPSLSGSIGKPYQFGR